MRLGRLLRFIFLVLGWVVSARAGEGAGTVTSPSSSAVKQSASVSAASLPPGPDESPARQSCPPAELPERKIIQEFGRTFVLSRSERNGNVDTEEYFLENESAASWTQLIGYQRVNLSSAITADRYVANLKAHLDEGLTGAHLRVVQQQKSGAVFALQYPKTDHAPPQIVLALATVPEAKHPNELHVAQLVLNPERLSLTEMETLMKRWQSRFQAQAAALAP